MATANGGPSRDSGWPDRSPLDIKIEQLQADHPGWKFWVSRDQRLVVATRIDGTVGVDRTLVEDDIPSMRAQLELQLTQAEKRPVPSSYLRAF